MRLLTVRNIVSIPIKFVRKRVQFASFEGIEAEHFAILIGDYNAPSVLVRVHSECMTGDMFGSELCDCGGQLHEALQKMDTNDGGIILYLQQEGRGIGLYAKLDAYALQHKGLDTFAANRALGFEEDDRDFTIAGDMLRALGVSQVRLITNNPQKRDALLGRGIDVIETIRSGVFLTPRNERYLRSKVEHRQHTIDLDRAGLTTVDTQAEAFTAITGGRT